jgi:hypothetical protein
MKNNKIKSYSLDEMIDYHIGTKETPQRTDFENNLQKDILAEIKKPQSKI